MAARRADVADCGSLDFGDVEKNDVIRLPFVAGEREDRLPFSFDDGRDGEVVDRGLAKGLDDGRGIANESRWLCVLLQAQVLQRTEVELSIMMTVSPIGVF